MEVKLSHRLSFFHLSGRSSELFRLKELAGKRPTSRTRTGRAELDTSSIFKNHDTSEKQRPSQLEHKLKRAGFSLSPTFFLSGSILLSIGTGLVSLIFVRTIFAPLFFLAGLTLPFAYLEKRISERAGSFALDYPVILLATASSVKVGMTPYQALKRSIQILPKNSLVRPEIEALLANLDAGMRRETAINCFGADFELPELDLFRAALLLSLEHGGQFAPTLHRLAIVSRDRLTLIHQAKVNTATMRMTSNIVLGLVPFVLITLSSRTPNFWRTLQENSLANTMATIGVIILGLSFYVLRRMSNFKP